MVERIPWWIDIGYTRRVAEQIGKQLCGSCRLWMTYTCPREHNVNGQTRGTDSVEFACEKFESQSGGTDGAR